MSIFVGLDCGGSSSRVIAVDSAGAILFQGQSGAANLLSTPENRIRKNLGHATNSCPEADFVCGCFAGLINDNVRSRGIAILSDYFPKAVLRAEPDYSAALYASPEADICVISGTGSLVCSRSQGKIVKSGGRGYILGDEGSGFQFGRDALLHFLNRPSDSSPNLKKTIQEIVGSLEESDIITAVYRAPSPATILAKIAKAVGQDALAKEPYALTSIKKNLTDLTRVVSGHISKHHPTAKNLSITLAGGIWKAGAAYKSNFQTLLESEMPGIEFDIQKLTKPPLYGAVELAKELTHGNRI